MEEDYPVNLRVEMSPDGSAERLPGSITITRTTISVFKLCELSDDEPLFVGVCSVPLLRFARVRSRLYPGSESLVLTSITERVFINASLSAGLLPRDDESAVSSRTESTVPIPKSLKNDPSVDELRRLDRPAQWTQLRLEFQSPDACRRCVEALLQRDAEDITEKYLHSQSMSRDDVSPKARSVRASASAASIRSYNQSSRRATEYGAGAVGDVSELMQSCRSQVMERDDRASSFLIQASKASSSHPQDSRRELETSRSEVRSPRESEIKRSLPARSQPTASQREIITPMDYQEGSTAPQSTHHSNKHAGQKNSTDNRRELGTPRSEVRSPRASQSSRSLPARSQPTDSRRELETPSELCTPWDSERGGSARDVTHNSNVVPRSSNGGGGGAEPPARSTHSSRRGEDFAANVRQSNNAVPQSYSVMTSTVPPTAVSPGPVKQAQPSSRVYSSAAYNQNTSPSEVLGVSQRSLKSRTEQQQFLRGVMKLMHHRLHFMQYLHKELVHEAYLAEEAKLFGSRNRRSRSTSMNHSMSRPTSVSPRSPRRTVYSSVAEESSRLREIEDRLRDVEKLQREAERDRQEALRLRHEAEKRIESIVRDSGSIHRNISPSQNNVDSHKPDTSFRSQSPHVVSQKHSFKKNDSTDMMQHPYQTKLRDSEVSRTSRPSTILTANGQVVVSSYSHRQPINNTETSSEADMIITTLDRYIYGDEWHLLYPVRETDVRFCALIDVCLMLKLPRRFVTILNISLDQPGLRLTVEIHHGRDNLSRDVVERRFSTQPFLLLKRLYELRYCFPGLTLAPGQSMRSNRHGSMAGSRVLTPGGHRRQSSASHLRALDYRLGSAASDDDDVNDGATDASMSHDVDSRIQELERQTQDRMREREAELAREREGRQAALYRERIRQHLDQLIREEDARRSRTILSEAQERWIITHEKDQSLQHPNAMMQHDIEGEELVERAKAEAGYARQMQALAQAHYRNFALVRMFTQERERRARYEDQEREDRLILSLMMDPQQRVTLGPGGAASQPELDELARRHRLVQAEAKQRKHIYANIRSFLVDALNDEVEALHGDEFTARMILSADEMKEWLDVVCESKTLSGRDLCHSAGVTPQAWNALLEEELAERTHLVNEEERRRRLYQRECILTTEDLARNEIELRELDEHALILENIMHRNRAVLERRRREQKDLQKLISEEKYYRKGIVGEEQDEWEVVMELFDSALNDVLLAEAARLAALSSAQDLESPQRRRRLPGTPRQAKPFHYMTFAPEDMDHPPSAALAIEGILGCSINKNLEVTSIERSLPRVDGEELQFQAGDMILDVAGFSLHSLSHLREVLANRAVRIQSEAREEFSDLPEEELTVNLALQRYIEMLCEHYNFLVQVLRGCDIFQIIVMS